MRSLELVNMRTNERTYIRTYVLTYIRTGQTLYPLHNFVVRGDNNPIAVDIIYSCFPKKYQGFVIALLFCCLMSMVNSYGHVGMVS